MVAYLVRYKENDSNVNLGVVFAKTKSDAFWLLDQFGNPNEFELIKVAEGAIMFDAKIKSSVGDQDFDGMEDFEYYEPEGKVEYNEGLFGDPDDGDWKHIDLDPYS